MSEENAEEVNKDEKPKNMSFLDWKKKKESERAPSPPPAPPPPNSTRKKREFIPKINYNYIPQYAQPRQTPFERAMIVQKLQQHYFQNRYIHHQQHQQWLSQQRDQFFIGGGCGNNFQTDDYPSTSCPPPPPIPPLIQYPIGPYPNYECNIDPMGQRFRNNKKASVANGIVPGGANQQKNVKGKSKESKEKDGKPPKKKDAPHPRRLAENQQLTLDNKPQLYVPIRDENGVITKWIPKPPVPPPLDSDTPETKEEKQRMWKEYRQAMKPFKNREFANAKRTIQRLGKRTDLDEKQTIRLQKAQEIVSSHKAMLTQKSAIRWLKAQDGTYGINNININPVEKCEKTNEVPTAETTVIKVENNGTDAALPYGINEAYGYCPVEGTVTAVDETYPTYENPNTKLQVPLPEQNGITTAYEYPIPPGTRPVQIHGAQDFVEFNPAFLDFDDFSTYIGGSEEYCKHFRY